MQFIIYCYFCPYIICICIDREILGICWWPQKSAHSLSARKRLSIDIAQDFFKNILFIICSVFDSQKLPWPPKMACIVFECFKLYCKLQQFMHLTLLLYILLYWIRSVSAHIIKPPKCAKPHCLRFKCNVRCFNILLLVVVWIALNNFIHVSYLNIFNCFALVECMVFLLKIKHVSA